MKKEISLAEVKETLLTLADGIWNWFEIQESTGLSADDSKKVMSVLEKLRKG